MTLAVDMQTRCTLVQCRTPREVRYLSSKANSFPRSIVFPGAIAFSTHAKPPTVVPCQRTTSTYTRSRPPGNPKAYHSPTQHCPLSREGRVGKKQKAVMLRSSVYLQGAATARSQPLDGCALTHLRTYVYASASPTKTCRTYVCMVA